MLFFDLKRLIKYRLIEKYCIYLNVLKRQKFNCLIWVMRKILLVFITLWLIVPAIYAQKVGLVLSGGGAKGLTHIGIIRALEEK